MLEVPQIAKSALPNEQLAYYRKACGLSVEELGNAIGIPGGEIVNYEKKFQEIYVEQAEKIADVLKIDVSLLMDDYTRFTAPGYGQRIKDIRALFGCSQNKFAEMMGVNRSTVSIWEIEYHRPSRKIYHKLMEYKASQEGREKMTHDEQREYLIQELLDEDIQYKGMAIPKEVEQQKLLLRSLMNVRLPKPISQEFMKIQDEYLCYERDAAGVVDAASLPAVPGDSRLVLWQGDITALKCDAIVNAANSQMRGCFRSLHSCIDNIVHTKAGIELRLKCNDMMQKQGHEEPTGRAKITPAYNLPSKYVLHTVGPIIETRCPSEKQKAQLVSCYRSCLELAAESGCKSIAFCCISTGVFMFPNQLAAEIAIKTVQAFLAEDTRIERVIFNVFKDLDKEIYEALLGVK